MARLPTPSIDNERFSTTSTIVGDVEWATATNLNDLSQVRVRYVRHRSTTIAASLLIVRTLAENSGGWTNFTSSGRTYQYRDDVITSGFDNTPTTYTDREVSFAEGNLTNYNVWALARLEV